MKAFVTGSFGFVGRWLAEELERQGWDWAAFDRKLDDDLLNYEQVRNALDRERPDVIFHLAAQAYVPESFINPKRTFEVNTLGSLNILEAVRQLGLKTTVHLAGTSEEYGDSQIGDGVILEDATIPNPLSPYAISKLAMDHLGRLYAKSYGMHVVTTRAFNHTGPGRGEMYAESSFAKQVAEVEAGKRDHVEHGNLKSVRNYSDVRDIVRAYIMASKLPSGVYNICSDRNVDMEFVLNYLRSLSKKEIPTKVNPALFRPSDFSFKEPNCSKFKLATKWEPEYELEETLEDLLAYWREMVK